jgi:hypothetical protein
MAVARALTHGSRIGSHIHPGVALIGKVSSVIQFCAELPSKRTRLIGDLVTHGGR